MSVRGRTIPTPLPIPKSENEKRTIEKINDYTTIVNLNNGTNLDYIKNCIPNNCQMDKIDETIYIRGLNCYEPANKCNTVVYSILKHSFSMLYNVYIYTLLCIYINF